MKHIFITLLSLLIVFSCCKLKKIDCIEECEELDGYHKFIVKEIVINEECNCIVSGYVKYIKDCQTVALVDYGEGECDNIATKIICKNGDCFDKNKNPYETYEYNIDCNGNNINDGPIDINEIEELYDSNTGPQP